MKQWGIYHWLGAINGVLLGLFLLGHAYQKYKCAVRWGNTDYSIVAGCIVITENGRIPEDHIRMVNWVYSDDQE